MPKSPLQCTPGVPNVFLCQGPTKEQKKISQTGWQLMTTFIEEKKFETAVIALHAFYQQVATKSHKGGCWCVD